jgi:putative Holliday junction resolvase
MAAIDYGTRRIGLAVSDFEQKIASPAGAIDAAGSPARDAQRVAEWSAANEVALIVVGLPLNMDGSEGPQAAITRKFVEQLRKKSTTPVETWDERLSSFQADTWLDQSGLSKKGRSRRRDSLAALAILSDFLARTGE